MQLIQEMKTSKNFVLFLLCLTLFWPLSTASADDATPTSATRTLPTPAEIIDAVNSLRTSNGLPALAAHPVLMQIAQEEANGIASGLPGHWRPGNMTLGQWMMSLGYPLLGDLSQDGYRSENWVVADTAEEAINIWLSDDPHTNTMLATERSDIGAGVSSNADGIYVVIETAWQTASGKMQYNAYPTLTALAGSVQYSGTGDYSQYMMPVAPNTALPSGEVYHEVQYGQTLWGIAINYNTTIKQIQQLNNLSDTTITVGQKLLVLKGATQPAPISAPTATGTPSVIYFATPEPTRISLPTPTQTIQPIFDFSAQSDQETRFGIGAIIFTAVLLAGIFTAMTRRKA